MTPFPFRRAIVALALLQSFALIAHAANEVSVTGHVTRASDHQPVVGAQVTLRELGLHATTGSDGSYSFKGVAAGSYTLVIEAGGSAVERHLEVGSSSVVGTEVALPPESVARRLEQITVTGQQSPAESARAAQQFAPNLINVTTASEIEKLPDVNAAEAVRRLPGISLETDTGEGRYINIRGIDSELNSTTFDGLRLPPQDNATGTGGGRAVAMDAIPAGIIGSITVTKTNLPDQDAEALGGTIEITSKALPVDSQGFVEGHVGTGVETLRSTGITDLEFSAGKRFGAADLPIGSWAGYSDRPFSFVVSASYYEDKRGIDDIEAGYVDTPGIPDRAYSAINQRYYQYNRKRHGLGLDLEYQPDGNNSWYFRVFDTGYTEYKTDNQLIWGLNGTPTASPTLPTALIDGVTSMTKELDYVTERVEDKIFMMGGKNIFDGGAVLDYRFGHAEGVDQFAYSYTADFGLKNLPGNASVEYDNQSNPDFVTIHPLNFNPYNWSNYTLGLGGISGQSSLTTDQENSLGANMRIPLHFTDDDNENFKFGINARFRDRTVTQRPDSYDIPAAYTNLSLTAVQAGGPVSYYNGAYQNGPSISGPTLFGLIGPQNSFFATGDIQNAQLAYLGAHEDVYAQYGQYEFGWGRWSFVAGVRVEETRATYSSIGQVTEANGNIISTSDTAGNSYNNAFPTVQGRYQFTPDLIARATISSAIARPGFEQNTSQILIDNTSNTVTEGNPALKPTTGTNYDLSIEDYLPYGGIAAFGLFDKHFSNYIAPTQITGIFPDSGPFTGFVGVSHLVSYINIPDSYARGMEVSYEQRFRQLPGWLGGLGFSGNFTYVDSSFQIRPGETAPLPSTSKHTANLELFYERGGLDLRLGAYYVSSDLFSIGTSRDNDTWSAPIVQLDLGASYAVDKHWSVYFNAKNLTNYALKFTEGTANRPIQREFYGPTYTTGVSFRFD